MKKIIIAVVVLIIISASAFVFLKVFLSPCEKNESGWSCEFEYCNYTLVHRPANDERSFDDCLELEEKNEKKNENYEEKCVEEGGRWGWCNNRVYFPGKYEDLDSYDYDWSQCLADCYQKDNDLYCDMAFDDKGKDCTNSEECQGRCVIDEELLVKERINKEEPKNEKVEKYNLEELNNNSSWNNNKMPDLKLELPQYTIKVGYEDEFTCEGNCIGYCSQYPLTNCDNWFEVIDDETIYKHNYYSGIEEKKYNPF